MNSQTPPDKIWLQWYEYDDSEWAGRTWCEDKQNDSDVEYVRVDTAKPMSFTFLGAPGALPELLQRIAERDKYIAELEADKIACVAVMRRMIGYRDRVGALSFQLEKADFFINQMRELLGDAEGEQ